MLFDSHAHYDDGRFEAEFEGGGRGAIEKAHREGVGHIVNVGSNLKTSINSIALAEEYSFIYASVGIHPSDAQLIAPEDVDKALYEVERLAKHEKVRAVGEIGFDYHYDGTDRERQTYFFQAQLEIARRCSLPVIIHSRDAAGDTFDLLRNNPQSSGVLHSYSGSAEMAVQLTRMGWYISFSGPLTYKNARGVKESAAAVPPDRILIETDCPYLPPTPHRGEINYSGYMKFTCAALAEIRGITYAEAEKLTDENARRFYRVSD
ncbi:MAG: TatD family hydrolase [Eubacteriales bacterium]